MSSMQQASDSAKKEWISFVEKGESRYQEDISSSARLRNNMENVLHQWYAFLLHNYYFIYSEFHNVNLFSHLLITF